MKHSSSLRLVFLTAISLLGNTSAQVALLKSRPEGAPVTKEAALQLSKLESLPMVKRAYLTEIDTDAIMKSPTVLLSLSPDTIFLADLKMDTKTESTPRATERWSGVLKNRPESEVRISKRGKSFYIRVRNGNELYVIRPTVNGLYVAIDVDLKKIPPMNDEANIGGSQKDNNDND